MYILCIFTDSTVLSPEKCSIFRYNRCLLKASRISGRSQELLLRGLSSGRQSMGRGYKASSQSVE